MKKTNLIKLLSVLLCTVLLFTSCDFKKEPETTTETTTQTEATTPAEDPTPKGPVEPVLENFFTISKNEQATSALKVATRQEGEIVSELYGGVVVVFRNATVDYTNTVTEVFTVYNAMLDKTVATFTNSYKYGALMFDWDHQMIRPGHVNFVPYTNQYQESALSVTLEMDWYDECCWIEVKRATLTPIDEAVIEENKGEGCAYDVKTSFEYYDVTGQLITKSPIKLNVFVAGYAYNAVICSFGDVKAYMNYDTGAMLKRAEGDGVAFTPYYEYENETYGYCINDQWGGLNQVYRSIEVYDKATDTKLFQYEFDYADEMEYWILENGNVLFQQMNWTDEGEDYDFYASEYGSVTIDTYLLNVRTQKVEAVECDFVIESLITKDLWDLYTRYFDTYQVDLSENVLNLATVRRINNKKLENTELLCLDNKLGVMFAMKPLTPEHKLTLDGFGFEILPNGDYLVDLYDLVTSRAIVKKDGTIRSYLKEGDKIAGDYVVNETGVFDYDGKELYRFDEENEWTFDRVFADNIIVTRENETDDPEERVTEYYLLKKVGNTFDFEFVFEDQSIVSDEDADDYLITQNDENGKYTIYNVDLEHLLTTANEVSVYEHEGNYIAMTELEGETLYYTLK